MGVNTSTRKSALTSRPRRAGDLGRVDDALGAHVDVLAIRGIEAGVLGDVLQRRADGDANLFTPTSLVNLGTNLVHATKNTVFTR